MKRVTYRVVPGPQIWEAKLYQFDDDFSSPACGKEGSMPLPTGDGDDQDCGGSGVIISLGVEIYPQFRGQGLGQEAHASRLELHKSSYNYALCTVRRDNDPQLHILKKNGWVRLANTASNLGNPIYIMGRSLK